MDCCSNVGSITPGMFQYCGPMQLLRDLSLKPFISISKRLNNYSFFCLSTTVEKKSFRIRCQELEMLLSLITDLVQTTQTSSSKSWHQISGHVCDISNLICDKILPDFEQSTIYIYFVFFFKFRLVLAHLLVFKQYLT